MRYRLAASPALPSALSQAAFFAMAMAAWWHFLDHDSWRHALIGGAITGALYSVATYFTTRHEQRAHAAQLAGLDANQRRAVERAASTGKAPAEPSLRVRAAALVTQRLAAHERSRTFTIAVFAVFAAMGIALAITDGPWYLAEAALFGALLIWTIRYRDGLSRRLSNLELPPPSPAPAPKSAL